MDEDDIEYLFKVTITVRKDGEITDILEMPEGLPYSTIGFIATEIQRYLYHFEPEDITIEIQPFVSNAEELRREKQ